MKFVWDTAKAASNKKKHGVDFATATLVFSDQSRIESSDTAHSQNEDRRRTIGRAKKKILFVVFTEREGDTIRIISARKADKDERRKYHRLHYGP